jgi:hypothetical protein
MTSPTAPLPPLKRPTQDFRFYFPYTYVRDPHPKGAAGACVIVRSQAKVVDRLRTLRQQLAKDERELKIQSSIFNQDPDPDPED